MNEPAALTVCSLLALSSPQTSQGTASPPPQAGNPSPTSYAMLVDRLIAGDRTVDSTELRMAFAATAGYHGMMMRFYQPLWRTLGARDFKGAIQLADNDVSQS